MTNELDKIWEGDQLNRRAEAVTLERFLTTEIATFQKQERKQSYVLALDAQYGEGKTWFLDRLTRQLQINHPVAFVDAWIDDANDEPFVAIMSAVEEALAPLLSKNQKMLANFKGATRAALPIIGKLALAAATKVTHKYMGEAIGSEIAAEISKAKDTKASEANLGSELALDTLDKTNEEIAKLVDKQAEAMLLAYRQRKESRAEFKSKMSALAAQIGSSTSTLHPPLFVVIDELDRCRPSYAIKLLEEVKHFFDVPGVVFIIALHGAQLTKSINAVYGNEFDSESYLQRFFTRRYEMRRLPVRELVVWLMSLWEYEDTRLDRPPVQGDDNRFTEMTAAEFCGRFLEEFRITPRECFSVIDALRIFYQQWDHKAAIELSWVLILIILQLKNKPSGAGSVPPSRGKMRMQMPYAPNDYNRSEPIFCEASAFVAQFWNVTGYALPDVSAGMHGQGPTAYMKNRLEREFSVEHNNSHSSNIKPYSLWLHYWDKLTEIGRLVGPLS